MQEDKMVTEKQQRRKPVGVTFSVLFVSGLQCNSITYCHKVDFAVSVRFLGENYVLNKELDKRASSKMPMFSNNYMKMAY